MLRRVTCLRSSPSTAAPINPGWLCPGLSCTAGTHEVFCDTLNYNPGPCIARWVTVPCNALFPLDLWGLFRGVSEYLGSKLAQVLAMTTLNCSPKCYSSRNFMHGNFFLETDPASAPVSLAKFLLITREPNLSPLKREKRLNSFFSSFKWPLWFIWAFHFLCEKTRPCKTDI